MSALKIKDAQGNWIEVPMIKGDKGDKGEQGDTYELTEQDKQDIAELVEVPEPLKYVKDDPSDNGGVIEGYVDGDYRNNAQGDYSHAEGLYTLSYGLYSHAEGEGSSANGQSSHAENEYTVASGKSSHAENISTTARGIGSHAEGIHTAAFGNYQHVQGKYNIVDNDNIYAHIVGGGTEISRRANIHTLDWNGNGVYAGKLTVGTAPTNDMDVATKKYVDDVKGASIHICSSEEYDSTTRVPTIQNPDEKTFYLVPSEDGTSPDLFVEWAYVNNAWEMFGSASIDLSGYLTDVTVGGTSVVNNGVAEIPVATQQTLGVVSYQPAYGITLNTGNQLRIDPANDTQIKAGESNYKPIVVSKQHEATFYGLAKASGDSTQSASSNAVGTYTDEAKASIQNMLGVPSVDDIPDVPVEDVQIDGTSIVSNGVANVPVATSSVFGVTKAGNGLFASSGALVINKAPSNIIKAGTQQYAPIVPYNQHESTFYGLAKAAGHDEKNSTLALGNYTSEAKGAIQSMLGIDSLIAPTETNPFTEAHAIGELFIINGALYKAKTAIAVGDVLDDGVNVDGVNVDDVAVKDVQINGTSVVSNGVAEIPNVTTSRTGLASVNTSYGIGAAVNGSGILMIQSADLNLIKVATGYGAYKPIVPTHQHESVFYGLAKASGDTTQSQSDNAVGTYTDDAKSSIQTMLGLSDVVRNTDYCTDNTSGVARTNSSFGVTATSTGNLRVSAAASNQIKAGTDGYKPITPVRQHESVFYGLTKAAGVDMASSSNAVGTYTDEAKTAIKQMLGVVDSYDSLVVNVSGTDPVITGSPSYRYNCGEVTSLTVTPPSSGTIDIIFTSGTTPTVLDLPNTIKMPSWWISTEANTTYEMCITDGVYCGVMSWDA